MCVMFNDILFYVIVWIFVCINKVHGCTSTAKQYEVPGNNVTIQFQAFKVNSVNANNSVTNQIMSNKDSPLLSALYKNGVNTYISPCHNCTFTGNAATGDLSIRLDNLQVSEAGTYKHAVTKAIREVKGCAVVYILGQPKKPSITLNKEPFEGESATLTCSSISTTTPRDPSIRMMYNWKVDDSNIPSDARYTYSNTRNKLTISNISRNDANKHFTCTAKEDVSNSITSSSSDPFKLDVYYKPDSGPLINSLQNKTIFHAIKDRQQSLDCSVTGGYPSPSLSWACFTGTEQDLSSGQTITRRLTWTASRNGTCKCISTQMGAASEVVLNVRILSPPTSPEFQVNSQTVQPSSTVKVIRDSTKPITCSSTSYPPSEYNWTYNGHTTEVSQEATLNPSQVTKNGRYYCNAQNRMTPSLGGQESGNSSAFIDIQRLYGPSVKPLNVEPVVEGFTLSVECKADPGNPASMTYTWRRNINSSSMNNWQNIPDSTINGGQLVKQNINRNDTGTYSCTASNVMKPTAENQQIGSSSQKFLFDVFYPASILSFLVKGHVGKPSVILDENDEEIQIICEVDSNPASNIKILLNGKVIKAASATKITLLTLRSVSCLDSGEYTCEGSNDIGQPSQRSMQLLVNCSPRPLHRVNQNISSLQTMQVILSFTALAYPNPGAKGFSWHKENGNNWTQVLANKDLLISSTALQSNLTIQNVTKIDYGRYRLTIKNDLGTYVQYFDLTDKKVDTGLPKRKALCNRYENNDNTIITGITLGIVNAILVGYGAFITILYKRRSRNRESGIRQEKLTQKTYMNISYNKNATENQQGKIERNAACSNEIPDDENKQYTDLSEYSRDDKTAYDILSTQLP